MGAGQDDSIGLGWSRSPSAPRPFRRPVRVSGMVSLARAGSSVGTSVRLKSGRSAVRPRPCPRARGRVPAGTQFRRRRGLCRSPHCSRRPYRGRRTGSATTTALLRYLSPFQSSQVTSTSRLGTDWSKMCGACRASDALPYTVTALTGVPDLPLPGAHRDRLSGPEGGEMVEGATSGAHHVPGDEHAPEPLAGSSAVGPPPSVLGSLGGANTPPLAVMRVTGAWTPSAGTCRATGAPMAGSLRSRFRASVSSRIRSCETTRSPGTVGASKVSTPRRGV